VQLTSPFHLSRVLVPVRAGCFVGDFGWLQKNKRLLNIELEAPTLAGWGELIIWGYRCYRTVRKEKRTQFAIPPSASHATVVTGRQHSLEECPNNLPIW